MTDKQVQTKLNKLVKLCNELNKEAERRYGHDGFLFFESDGAFHLMDGDSDSSISERQSHARFTSDGYCTMGAGAW